MKNNFQEFIQFSSSSLIDVSDLRNLEKFLIKFIRFGLMISIFCNQNKIENTLCVFVHIITRIIALGFVHIIKILKHFIITLMMVTVEKRLKVFVSEIQSINHHFVCFFSTLLLLLFWLLHTHILFDSSMHPSTHS